MTNYDLVFTVTTCIVTVGTLITAFFVRREMKNLNRKSSEHTTDL